MDILCICRSEGWLTLKHLIIIGVGGFGREVYWHAQNSLGYGAEWNLKGFLDGDVRLPDEEYEKLKLPVVGDINSYQPQDDDCFICAIVNSVVRKRLTDIIQEKGGAFINLIHRTTILSGNVKMGIGNVFSPYTTVLDSVKMGNFNIFNVRTGIGHDASLGDYNSLMSAVDINGFVRIGNFTYLGDSASTIPHSKIEDGAFVGACSLVLKKVKAGKKVFGVPAVEI